jgi:2'-5' RNA ligase
MSDRWRLFVAVPISEELRSSLAAAVEEWRERVDLAGLRWSDPASLHVTLHFLGTTDSAAVPAVMRAIGAVTQRHAPLRLATGGLGAFPSGSRARVAWYGVDDRAGGLRRLAADVRQALAVEAPGPFRAHVTLARAREAPLDLREWTRAGGAPQGELNVSDVRLMRSPLGRGPAQYETLETMRLGAAVHA